jgi:RND family efflux transporter MFP subunit
MKTKKTVHILTLTAVIGIAVWKLAVNKQETDAVSARSLTVNPAVPVRIEQVRMQRVPGDIRVDGRIQAAAEVTLYSKAQGVVVSKYKKAGDRVGRGMPVAQVENSVIREALSLAEMNLANAGTDVERYRKLADAGAVTRREYEAMQVACREAQRTVTGLQDQLNSTTLTSPVNGILETDYFEEGTLLSIGTQVADFIDPSQLKAVVSITESDVYRIQKGDRVILTAGVLPGREFTGIVDVIGSKANSLLNSRVEIKITDRDAGILKAGMYASAHIAVGESTATAQLVIDRKAIIESLKNPEVYVVRDSKAYRQAITAGNVFDRRLTVVSGLNEGDSVVVAGQINLVDGRNIETVK